MPPQFTIVARGSGGGFYHLFLTGVLRLLFFPRAFEVHAFLVLDADELASAGKA